MGRKHHMPEEIVAKLRQLEILAGQGRSIAEAGPSIALHSPPLNQIVTASGNPQRESASEGIGMTRRLGLLTQPKSRIKSTAELQTTACARSIGLPNSAPCHSLASH